MGHALMQEFYDFRRTLFKSFKGVDDMFKILGKNQIAPNVHKIVVEAPLVAKKAKPGNFLIIRVKEAGERIPITISNHDPIQGTVTIVVQAVGKSTRALAELKVGDSIRDLLGPLGTPAEIGDAKSVVAICGGIGLVPTLPLLRAYKQKGAKIVTVLGARSKELLVLREEVEEVSDEVIYVTDDGSFGLQGLVTQPLLRLLEEGHKFDQAIAIGPARMMQAACQITAQFQLPTLVSLNAIMVDGTGMCGACRVTVGGQTKFSCVDGPDFDGHQVNFEELILRQAFYRDEENYQVQDQGHGGEECQCHTLAKTES